ncbi:MAG: hypothetical protein ACKVJJ_00900 [Fidelibacterota bacterium]|jgi:hypothetical protein
MNKLFLLLLPIFLISQEDGWQHIQKSRKNTISGIAAFKNGNLVVHDNKNKNQPRISYIDNKLRITKLIWPATELPQDLEAVAIFPGIQHRFILMESKGKCYEIIVDPKGFRIDLINTFTLPGLSPRMNLEGLTIFESGQGAVFIYGDRGSNSRPSTLFTAFFNPKKKSFYELNQFEFDLPIPKKYRRNISDLALKSTGKIWTSATSATEGDGSSTTAIYELGEINNAGTFTPNHPNLLKPIMVIAKRKVEAMIFRNRHLVLIANNKNLGPSYKKFEL